MKKHFYLLFILAHILLAVSFLTDLPFWVMFTVSFFILSVAAINSGNFDYHNISASSLGISIFSGLLLYGLFIIGKFGSGVLLPNQLADVTTLYMKVQPQLTWHYFALFLIIIPGEELFWRGYIQGRIEYTIQNKKVVVILSSLLYTSANIYTLNPLFLLATFAGGVIWGSLYMWKRNILLVILSHLIFNLFLLVLFPIF